MKCTSRFIASVLMAVLASAAVAQLGSRIPSSESAATAPTSRDLNKPVIRVNGVVLTDRDLLREEYSIFPYAKQHGGKVPREMEAGIRDGALKMIVFDELVYQEARRRGLAISAESLNRAEADLRRQFETPAEFRYFLKSEFQGDEQLMREKIRRSLLIEQLLKVEVHNKAVVSEAELRAFYEANPKNFEYPESFAIQTISIIPPAKATADQLKQARQRANDALTKAKTTKTAQEFGLLAEKISEDDYRVMMGDHKWVHRDQMPPQMLEPALKMQAGEISGLIQVENNYVIFRMNRHVPTGKVGFSEIKERLRAELKKKKADALSAGLDKRLRKNARIETL